MSGKDRTGKRKSVFATLGASSHTDHDREQDDFYATDPKAIDCLLSVETPSPFVWECAAGQGHLAERLKQNGYKVFASDLVDRGYAIDKKQDFLLCENLPPGYEDCDVVTNPPYKLAQEFVLKALELVKPGRKVYMFLKLLFLEGKARYAELFRKYPPRTVYVFSERIMCAMNADFDQYSASATCYAWFVWEKGNYGTTEIKWLCSADDQVKGQISFFEGEQQ